jgi:hypothetical protein
VRELLTKQDRWESVGPVPHGTAADPAGWVDPNCLAIDKLACEAVQRWRGAPQPNTPTPGCRSHYVPQARDGVPRPRHQRGQHFPRHI